MHSRTVTMGSNVYIGMAVTGNSTTTLATGTFDNVSVTGGGGGPTATPTATSSPTPVPTNTPSPTPTSPGSTPTFTPTPTATSPGATNTPTPSPTPPPAPDPEVVIRRVTYSIAGQAIALRMTGHPDGNNGIYYLHNNHLGSNSVMSTMNGTEVSTTRYLPFGGYRTETTGIGNSLTDQGFTGHKENRDIGLIYMNARFYVPNTNRWLSPDSIVPDPTNPQSFNRYSYVENRPLNLHDPSGHAARYYDEELDAVVYLSDQSEQRAVEEMWIEFVQEQQAKLNANERDIVTFATSTEELRSKRFISSTQEAATPKTYRELSQVTFWSEVAVNGYINGGVPPGQCYCHVLVGTTFGLPGPLIDPESNKMQQSIFRSDTLIPYTNSISLFVLGTDGNESHVHSAVVAFNDSENPGNSILLQVNGSETNSGFYFTRLQSDIDAPQWSGIAYLSIPLQVSKD